MVTISFQRVLPGNEIRTEIKEVEDFDLDRILQSLKDIGMINITAY